MKRVMVEVTTPDGKDNGATPMTVLLNRGAGDVKLEGKDYVTNKDGKVSFDLKPGMSLLVECGTDAVVAYDKDQAAAYTPHTQKGDEATDKAPVETQDSRLKSSPGTTVTSQMAKTPAANTGASASKPDEAKGLSTKQPANLQPSQAGKP